MSDITKQDILNSIRKTAKENGGIPLGIVSFEKETGIQPYIWHKYWVKFSDALKEAGFTPNRRALEPLYSQDFLVEKVIQVMRKLRKFPTHSELFLEKNQNAEFPYRAIVKRLSPKQKMIRAVLEFSKIKEYEDIIKICETLLEEDKKDTGTNVHFQNLGEVYLFKSGRYYKIGKTNDTVRRGNEIRIQLPEKMDLVHSIKTDDPNGIEAYWHRRFEAKRMQGEWFNLNSEDIKAFRRWRRII